MHRRHSRTAFTLSQLIVLLALLALFLGFLLSAVSRVRQQAQRATSQNNLKQIILGTISLADANNGNLPSGSDGKFFSAHAQILPYIEQGPLFNSIDFKKGIDDKANEQARKAVIRTYLSPIDPLMNVNEYGATNYQFNTLVFPHDKPLRYPADIRDGTSNTIFLVETLMGDGNKRAVDVRRQHVVLEEQDVGNLTEEKRNELGVQDFKEGKNIAADRGASWMDGRFLQGTFGPGRRINDPRPDVVIRKKGGLREGLSGPRSLTDSVNVGLGDGSVRPVNMRISYDTWKAVLTPSSDDRPGNDWD